MAIAPSSRYPAQTDAAAGYPQGKARNAGSFQDGTGTPLEKDWVNDLWGFLQALLSNAGLAPSGTPDAVGASQYLSGVTFIAQQKADAAQAAAIAAAAITAAAVAAAATAASEKRLIVSNWQVGEIIDPTVTLLAAIAWCPSIGTNGGTFIAGGSNKIVKSTNGGISWSLAAGVGGLTGIKGFADNGAGVVVGVGGSGSIARSTDGNTWAAQTSGTGNSFYDVCWHINKFIAVGDSFAVAPTIRTSPDGITWTTRSASGTESWVGIASNGSLAVAIGDGGAIFTSPDGVTWTSRTNTAGVVMTGIAWNGSLFVAVGGAAIQTSPDGITWTVRTNPLSGASFKSVDAVDTSFVATTTIGSGQGALASADGITWLQIRDPAFAGFSSSIAMSVAWSGVMAIAVGQATPSGTVFARSLRRLSL
jgi:hypothetical protein